MSGELVLELAPFFIYVSAGKPYFIVPEELINNSLLAE
jgi:hypothetical protein